MKELSVKSGKISASMTLAITAKAKSMKANGIDVVSFGAGEPDFNTPEYIRTAAIDRIEKGGIGYTPASGLKELKDAICAKLKRDNGLDYEAADIVVSSGAKHSLFNVFQVLLDPGDEVIIPAPYWVSYTEHVKLADGVPVLVRASEEDAFKLSKELFESAITDKTKAIIINSPNNPTGTVYSEAELRVLAEVAEAHDLYIISDEIYEKLVYGEKHVSIAALSESIKDRTIVINGMSKAYAMTGWRIGYTASSREIAKRMGNIQSHATSNPNTIAQYASIEGLNGDQSPIEAMRQAFDTRRKFMVERINSIDHISCIEPKGAFYVMMNINALIDAGKIENSMDFASRLLDDAKVAVIPGIAFDAEGFVRLSYATSQALIEEGLNRIEAYIKTL